VRSSKTGFNVELIVMEKAGLRGAVRILRKGKTARRIIKEKASRNGVSRRKNFPQARSRRKRRD